MTAISYEYSFDEDRLYDNPYNEYGYEKDIGPALINDLNELIDLPIYHGQEFTGGKYLEKVLLDSSELINLDESDNDPVITGVYTIRIGNNDRIFSWLKQIGNKNMYTKAAYIESMRYGRDLHHGIKSDFLDIEDLVYKYKKKPEPSEMLTFYIKQFSTVKKEFMKNPKLERTHYDLDFFYQPYKRKNFYENTPFECFINQNAIKNLKESNKDEKFQIKKKFLSKNREVVELFVSSEREKNSSVKKFDEIENEIKKLTCLIFGIYNKFSDADNLLNEVFGRDKYIYKNTSKLPTAITNTIINKMNYKVPDSQYGITYHPILEDLGKINIGGVNHPDFFNENYLEEDYLMPMY